MRFIAENLSDPAALREIILLRLVTASCDQLMCCRYSADRLAFYLGGNLSFSERSEPRERPITRQANVLVRPPPQPSNRYLQVGGLRGGKSIGRKLDLKLWSF